MPQLGLGVYKIPLNKASHVVSDALQVGYRSIDTAALYANEEGVGSAINEAQLAREQIFITTKVWNSDHGYDSTLAAFDTSMAKLDLDYLDLYLIHWPVPSRDAYVDTWRALERLYADGRVRAIGVSNFQPEHITRLLDTCEIVPAVNQIELHPYLNQHELRRFHQAHNIATEAWSPLARGRLLQEPKVIALGKKYDKTPAQIIIRWHIQLGNIVIPKSANPERVRENIDVFDFELADDDMLTMRTLNNNTRTGVHPDMM